jgi:ATP-binding cassette subfamily B protein
MANLLQSGVASAERVFQLLDAEEQDPDAVEPEVPTDRSGRVAFEHVSFRYEEDQPLIEDLSLVAEPGHTVAIVGPTGAGKTTLVNLVMRFYELDGGRITLDGVDITAMRREELRSQIGMVLQDTWLFGGTIRENIAYGSPHATEEQIRAAAGATFVDRFVQSLPDGYDTLINEEASNISVGEKQLITIARAFLSEPSLLILDEATSSVDTRTELLRGPDELRHRPPAVHDPGRRPDPGHGVRADRRVRHARRAARRPGRVLPALQHPVPRAGARPRGARARLTGSQAGRVVGA